nr:hypothetical protein [Tanacetum cinerariifolium]
MAYTSSSSSSSSSSDSESVEERLVHYKKNEVVLTDKINVLNLEVKLRDKVLAEYKELGKAKKERDEIKLTLEKLKNSSKALNNLLDSQVSDKSKDGLRYKATSPAVEISVNSFDMLENQENFESRLDKGHHVVPLPFTGNYIPPKHDLRLVDKHFESMSIDVISNIAPSDVKTVDVNHKGVFSTKEPKLVMKNSFSPPIIEDWHSDDESEVEISPTVEQTRKLCLIMRLMLLRPQDVSGEAILKLIELMELYTKLSDRVLDLEKIKTAQAKEIADLKKRVKKIEKEKKVQNSRDEFIQDWYL